MPNGHETLIRYKSQQLDLDTFQPLEDFIDINLQAARQEAKEIIVEKLESLRNELARRENPFGLGAQEQEKKRNFLDLIITYVKETAVKEEKAA